MELYITNGQGTIKVTELCPKVDWSGDWQQCARKLETEILASATDKVIPVVDCALGSAVTMTESGKTLFEGYILSRQKSTNGSAIAITCFDKGFYMKRNKASYKFSGQTPDGIAKRVCTDFDIKIGSLASVAFSVTRNFFGCSLYDIIMTAYTLAGEKNGKKYYIVFDSTGLCVHEKKLNSQSLIIKGGSNLMDASTSESVENMVNQVAVYDENNRLITKIKDDTAIKLYGLMQEHVKQKEGAVDKAKSMLKENGLSQKITVNNLGNIACITGNTVVMQESYTGLCGEFYIDSDMHTWKNGQYFCRLTLNFNAMVDEKTAGELLKK